MRIEGTGCRFSNSAARIVQSRLHGGRAHQGNLLRDDPADSGQEEMPQSRPRRIRSTAVMPRRSGSVLVETGKRILHGDHLRITRIVSRPNDPSSGNPGPIHNLKAEGYKPRTGGTNLTVHAGSDFFLRIWGTMLPWGCKSVPVGMTVDLDETTKGSIATVHAYDRLGW